ncbi:MAG: hypothetical protein OZ913_00820 [Ignavibacteriaceae bacterium]|nr:MAG: hypothetical protein EDM69_09315 [Chlorobiota bacterium]MBV6398982.1 hypothetical protein [Ignavibacteria bacterium]MCC6886181.1 hypothetical protein [Ignavibacteriales bacterium]MCE7953890.1 hypothetical protein [Chlorobi bacterium CHB7]MDL1887796.1 hypothetical protein [Ignavibacteria bacterium CHB1]MEB2328830.1 hypothetical protein [Ignavibacteriaceae bacterium]
MNINADGDPHEFKILKSKGSYQWWYFDGIDFSSTYSFVIIFSTSFPFSPAYLKNLINDAQNINPLDFARVSFKLFKHGKLMHQSVQEFISGTINIVKRNDHIASLNIGRNSINFNGNKVSLKIRSFEKWAKRSIDADIDMTINSPQEFFSNECNINSPNSHYWSPAGINTDYVAKIKIRRAENQFSPRKKIIFEGNGYYDRNWGTEAVFDNILNWKRGRFIEKDLTLVFFDTTYRKDYAKQFKRIIITKGKDVLLNESDIEFEYQNSKNLWGLAYPSKIIIKGKKIIVKVSNNIKLYNSPFRIKFQSEFEVEFNDSNLNGMGISELINPKLLKRKWMYPLLNFNVIKHS